MIGFFYKGPLIGFYKESMIGFCKGSMIGLGFLGGSFKGLHKGCSKGLEFRGLNSSNRALGYRAFRVSEFRAFELLEPRI